MRSFALLLDLKPAPLSSILKEKRQIPIDKIEKIANKLKLSDKNLSLFITSALDGRVKSEDLELENIRYKREVINEELHYKIIAEWEYYAFLSLITLDNFQNDLYWISKKLEVTKERIEEVILDLILAEMITKDQESNLFRNKTRNDTSENIINHALIKSHQKKLQMAQFKLMELEPLIRDFCALTFTGNIAKMEKAKALIREFRDNIGELFHSDDDPKVDVFQLNIQLYPITNTDDF